jgi:hypothetical protein
MTFVSAGCALATYWPRSLYCKFKVHNKSLAFAHQQPVNRHNNLEFYNLPLLQYFNLRQNSVCNNTSNFYSLTTFSTNSLHYTYFYAMGSIQSLPARIKRPDREIFVYCRT